MQPYRSLLGLGLMLALAACNPFSSFGNKPVSDYKLNPHPKQRYDITMTIANAPGSFASVKSWMQYDVINSQCLPPPDSNPQGTSNHMTRPVPFELTRVSDTEYIGTVYTDFLLDEDYYGRGLCHWKLLNVGVDLKSTGAEKETSFLPSISLKDLRARKAVTLHFWERGFPRSAMDDYSDSGMDDPNKFKPEIRKQLFSITITPKEVQP